MPENTSNITDDQLIEKLKNSYINEDQKKELEALIPEMNDEEKMELIGLIEKAEDEKTNADKKYQEDLGELNKEYTGKMENLVKDETKNAYKEFEKEDVEKTAEEIKEFETEIKEMPTNQNQKNKKRLQTSEKKHTLRNIIIILFLLLLISGGVLYALTMF